MPRYASPSSCISILIQCLKKRFECLGHSFWHQIVSSSRRRRRNDPECHSSFATHIAAIWSKLWWWNWMVTSHIHMSLCLTSVYHHHRHASACFPFLFMSHRLEDLGSNCEQEDEESRMSSFIPNIIAAGWSKLWWWHWTITSHKSLYLTIASGVLHRHHHWAGLTSPMSPSGASDFRVCLPLWKVQTIVEEEDRGLT